MSLQRVSRVSTALVRPSTLGAKSTFTTHSETIAPKQTPSSSFIFVFIFIHHSPSNFHSSSSSSSFITHHSPSTLPLLRPKHDQVQRRRICFHRRDRRRVLFSLGVEPPHRGGSPFQGFVRRVRDELGVPVNGKCQSFGPRVLRNYSGRSANSVMTDLGKPNTYVVARHTSPILSLFFAVPPGRIALTTGRPSSPSRITIPVLFVPMWQSTCTQNTGPPSGYFPSTVAERDEKKVSVGRRKKCTRDWQGYRGVTSGKVTRGPVSFYHSAPVTVTAVVNSRAGNRADSSGGAR